MSEIYALTKDGSEVVTLSEMKKYLRVHDSDVTQDVVIDTLIEAWTKWASEYTWRSFNNTSWNLSMDEFRDVEIRKNPVKSIVVKYYDSSDVEQTMDVADYTIYKSVPAKVEFKNTYPVKDRPDAVNIEITAGSAPSIIPVIKAGIMFMVSLQFWRREDHNPILLPDQYYISMAKQVFYPIRLNYF